MKKKPKGGGDAGGGRKAKSGDPYDGINDFSDLAAVFDFYEVCVMLRIL